MSSVARVPESACCGTIASVDTSVYKAQAAEQALEFVRDGQTVGLGTGSTADFATRGLARRLREGLVIIGVPTSEATARLARDLGIPLRELNEVDAIDITIDGADEVDPAWNLIKGGGGAHTREKLVARATRLEVIVVDSSKLVRRLGETIPVPVEVLSFGWHIAQRGLEALGCTATLRHREGELFLTDNGNLVLDCHFNGIDDPAALERAIKALPGVIESGLFVGLTGALVVAGPEGVRVDRPSR
jgi:ribose 5-phosphate isomerase A